MNDFIIIYDNRKINIEMKTQKWFICIWCSINASHIATNIIPLEKNLKYFSFLHREKISGGRDCEFGMPEIEVLFTSLSGNFQKRERVLLRYRAAVMIDMSDRILLQACVVTYAMRSFLKEFKIFSILSLFTQEKTSEMLRRDGRHDDVRLGTLSTIDFPRTRPIYTCLHYFGLAILCKTIICPLQEYRVCISSIQVNSICKNYMYMQVHIIQWHASTSVDYEDGILTITRGRLRIRAALDKSSSWFKQSTSCFTCLRIHALLIICVILFLFLEFQTLYIQIINAMYMYIHHITIFVI